MMTRKLFLAILFTTFCLTAGKAQYAKHVVLITIDGFRPDFYLDPSWGAVNLRQLKARGTSAKGVTGIFPTVTFPSHTTLVTGEKPAKHGIYYNAIFQPNAPAADWYWHFDAIKSPTLWEAVRKAGMTTGSVLWPVSVGAPIDYNVPDIWTLATSDRLEITGRYSHPPGFWEEVQTFATGKLEPNDFNLDKDYLSMDENVARMAGYIIRKYKPALTTVHLAAVDHAEHHDGRDGEQVRRAVAGADRSIRTIIEAIDKAGIKESTAIVITGDHGFVDRHTNFSPNVLLAKAGLINNVTSGDWRARFHSAGGSAFLYLKDNNDTGTLAEVRKILTGLPAAQRKIFTVIEGEKLKNAEADPEAMLALTAARGYAFTNASSGELLKPSRGGSHGYFPDFPEIQTGFIGSGSGFKKGVEIRSLEMVDIAPLVAELLGIDFKEADRKLYEEMLSNETMRN